jgi:hypothetical protein
MRQSLDDAGGIRLEARRSVGLATGEKWRPVRRDQDQHRVGGKEMAKTNTRFVTPSMCSSGMIPKSERFVIPGRSSGSGYSAACRNRTVVRNLRRRGPPWPRLRSTSIFLLGLR